jgi:ABC-type Fe3+/spermidine/putrescine transport system ATPase subunit
VLKSIIQEIGERLQTSCILASHDPQDSLPWADEMLVLKEGRIVQRGRPEDVYFRPLSEYVGGLLGAYNLIDPKQAEPFYGLAGVKKNGKSLFIRPEKISILRGSREMSGMLDGIVSKVSFLGGAYEIEVQVWGTGSNRLLVRSSAGDLAAGDVVGLFFPPEGIWYI